MYIVADSALAVVPSIPRACLYVARPSSSWCLPHWIHGFIIGLCLCWHMLLIKEQLGTVAFRTRCAMDPVMRPTRSWCHCTHDAWLIVALFTCSTSASVTLYWPNHHGFFDGVEKSRKLFSATASDLSASIDRN